MRKALAIACLALASCASQPATLEEALVAAERHGRNNGYSHPDFLDARSYAVIEAPETLVIHHSNVKIITRTFDPQVMQKEVRGDLCRHPPLRHVIEKGGTVQVETTTHIGSVLPTMRFTRC